MSLFQLGKFRSHSGVELDWKIECDALTDDDWAALAAIVARRLTFRRVVGIPRGGLKFAAALERHVSVDGMFVVIVDDVLTTGQSLEKMYERLRAEDADQPLLGLVVFARGTASIPSLALLELGYHWRRK